MCSKCGVEYPKTTEFYYIDWRIKKLRPYCKAYLRTYNKAYNEQYKSVFGKPAPMPDWIVTIPKNLKVELYKPNLIHPSLPIKDSEYHKNLERTDSNPKFFNWLCSGSNLEFNSLKTCTVNK